MGFADSVNKSATKIQEQVNTKINSVADELFKTIVIKTPILKGILINNWHLGQGKGEYNRSFTSAANTGGMNSYNQISKLKNSRQFFENDGEVSLTNSTSYAIRAEYIGWPSPEWTGRVKPYAMVRNSLTIVAAKYRG